MSASRLATGAVASSVEPAVASPAWPFIAYSILRSRASRRSMVSVAVLSRVLSIAMAAAWRVGGL